METRNLTKEEWNGYAGAGEKAQIATPNDTTDVIVDETGIQIFLYDVGGPVDDGQEPLGLMRRRELQDGESFEDLLRMVQGWTELPDEDPLYDLGFEWEWIY